MRQGINIEISYRETRTREFPEEVFGKLASIEETNKLRGREKRLVQQPRQ